MSSTAITIVGSRFRRENELLASLNEPNIAGIYHLPEANGTRFLALELVEGETLADVLKRGLLPIKDVVRSPEASAKRSKRGIVHRDIKPANAKINRDSQVKVLDFGLAKALENTAASASLSNSPTLSRFG